MAATPATTTLKSLGIPFELLEYAHDPRSEAFGLEAVEKLGLDAETVFKTLVVSDGGKAHALVLVPAAEKLALSAAARALGWKRAEMADKGDAMRLTGYVLGGISPFGTKKSLPVLVDETFLLCETVHFSGGQRGLEIRMAPDAFVTALAAITADIVAR